MAPFIFWNLAFYTIIRTQLHINNLNTKPHRKLPVNIVGVSCGLSHPGFIVRQQP
ncbi:LexA repressor-like protein [Paenibacillus larvae subsp. larvae DSM 25430]|nr:LexA repressor-like protein [Paenibacillus larvae subsp. larvae DSM 25430]